LQPFSVHFGRKIGRKYARFGLALQGWFNDKLTVIRTEKKMQIDIWHDSFILEYKLIIKKCDNSIKIYDLKTLQIIKVINVNLVLDERNTCIYKHFILHQRNNTIICIDLKSNYMGFANECYIDPQNRIVPHYMVGSFSGISLSMLYHYYYKKEFIMAKYRNSSVSRFMANYLFDEHLINEIFEFVGELKEI
jgi:hypothetical protein